MTTRREMLARSASVAAALAGLGLLPQAAQARHRLLPRWVGLDSPFG